MRSTSPIVDCGVHYVDVMCQITDAKPVRVSMGLRLSSEIAPDMYNYGQLQVHVRRWFGRLVRGWLGADDVGDRVLREGCDLPNGAVSIVDSDKGAPPILTGIRVGACCSTGQPATGLIDCPTSPAIRSSATPSRPCRSRDREDIDLRAMQDAVPSLRICLAADESIRSRQVVDL